MNSYCAVSTPPPPPNPPKADVLHFSTIDRCLAAIGPPLALNGTSGSEMSFMCWSLRQIKGPIFVRGPAAADVPGRSSPPRLTMLAQPSSLAFGMLAVNAHLNEVVRF